MEDGVNVREDIYALSLTPSSSSSSSIKMIATMSLPM